MPRIPFIEARFFPSDDTQASLERRFLGHLRKLRSNSATSFHLDNLAEESDIARDRSFLSDVDSRDRAKVKSRVGLLLERRRTVSCVGHLRAEEQERLSALRFGVSLIAIESDQQADEIAAELHDDMPWMAQATEHVWRSMRRSVRRGAPGLQIPALLLDGPPGIGKSYWARRLGELISAPTTVIEATGENASFSVVGSQRGWGSACPGRPLEAILQSGIGNPVVIVDEIEKAGTPLSRSGQTHGLEQALLPLLEPMTAARWSCPYYQVKFDMSWITWVLTSNDWQTLSAPLLSRCAPIRLRDLTPDELSHFVRRDAAQNDISDDAANIVADVLEKAVKEGQRPDIRFASRLLRLARDVEEMPVRH